MTSRALFYKGMIEDLRHRVWMIALSCLGSFLAMPVFFLLVRREWDDRITRWTESSSWDIEEYKLTSICSFFNEYLTVTCGIILVAGALIVGIFGFRFVFSKKMVDLYHSIPITRKQLFLIHYLNGFIIWFVPMLIGAVICAVFALFFLGSGAAWMTAVGKLLITVGNLVLAFLLVYHVAIVAVMLSGNIINTLISGAIISFGVLAAYCMLEGFAGTYFDTYYSFFNGNMEKIIWASPIPAAIYQLYMRGVNDMQVLPLVMNIFMIAATWLAGFVIYNRRPSELAEQGMKMKAVQVVFKTLVTCMAGMVGWILFYFITGENSIGWMIFGAVLAGVLVYGILDIIFHMDFKAFFAHKLQMGITVIASVVIGFVFLFDLVGYDSYVPRKEDIADMGVYINNFGYSLTDTVDRIDEMEYTDQDTIYAFLERMTGKESLYPENGSSTMAYVRITEKSGKTYYRCYRVWESDEDVVVPILRDESYIETNMLLPQDFIEHIEVGTNLAELQGMGNYWVLDDVNVAREFLEAYNQDIKENPDLFITQEDEVLASAFFRCYSENYYYVHLDIYESMEHVKAVLEKYDYDNILEKPDAKDLESIEINIYASNQQNNLKVYFGLEEPVSEQEESGEQTIVLKEGAAEITRAEVTLEQKVVVEEYVEFFYQATFTKNSDINELMDIISLETPYRRTIFAPEYCSCDVILKLKDGDTRYVQIKKGVMPEKFLDDFVLTNQE